MSKTAVAAPIKLVNMVRKAASSANRSNFVTPRCPCFEEICREGKAEVQRSGFTRFLKSPNSRKVSK